MLTTIGRILHAFWAICTLAIGASLGAAVGFHWIGWIGAIVFGLIGLGIGALAAAFPLETIVVLLEGL